jgi:hypothetical protein
LPCCCNLVPQITNQTRRQSQEFGIHPEIVKQERPFISMSCSPKNCDNPTRFRETEFSRKPIQNRS